MISYEVYCKIHDAHHRQGLNLAQIARMLSLDPVTVKKWLNQPHFEPRKSKPRAQVLDPYKNLIVRKLEAQPYSAQQIFQQLQEEGYTGSLTSVRNYVRRVRPPQRPVYLKLHFQPGEVAQVDWGEYGSIAVGSTRRRLSFFVMVLAHSRLMYVEFTLAQTMEHFLVCHQHAFESLGGVVSRVMVDNLKSAVLRRVVGEAPVFNPRYLDFARHYGFSISACNVAKGNEKGRVESGVGYVKKNFLRGSEFTNFEAVNPAAKLWLETVANVRMHGETHQRPADMFLQEQQHLQPLNPHGYDVARSVNASASSQFRVPLDTNHYSVPPEFAHRHLLIKAYPDRVCIYFDHQLIARHPRSYDRHQDIEDPDHPKTLLAQRQHAREQRLMVHFMALAPEAAAYYEGLEKKRVHARQHVRKILALAEIYSHDEVARAIQDGLSFQAFSAEYIANILESRARVLPEPGPLQLLRSQDLLDIELSPPDLSAYEERRHDDP